MEKPLYALLTLAEAASTGSDPTKVATALDGVSASDVKKAAAAAMKSSISVAAVGNVAEVTFMTCGIFQLFPLFCVLSFCCDVNIWLMECIRRSLYVAGMFPFEKGGVVRPRIPSREKGSDPNSICAPVTRE